MSSAISEAGNEWSSVSKAAEESGKLRTGKCPRKLATVRVLLSVRKTVSGGRGRGRQA